MTAAGRQVSKKRPAVPILGTALALFSLMFVALRGSARPALWGRSARPAPDDHITRLCARHRVEPPPEFSPSAALIVAEAAHLLTTQGHRATMANTTFMQEVLPLLTKEERERLAYEVHSTAIYLRNESFIHKSATKAAVLKAAPLDDLYKLNGVNVGAGGLPLHETLIAVDLHRGMPEGAGSQLTAYQKTSSNTLMAWADQLPFRSNSIDYIVSTHNLEHLDDPVAAVLHYLDIVKPGGGVGIVIPNWEYAWDARGDDHEWGHRWNTAPEVVCEMYHRHWSHLAELESLNTLPFRLAFDFVLRKKGEYVPFSEAAPAYPTGKQRWCSGSFTGPHDMRPVPADFKC